MKQQFITDEVFYDGANLQSLYAYKNYDLQGDSIIAFIGGCEVREHLVDVEDQKADAFIRADKMVHFIIEHFDITLTDTICRQRLLIAIIRDYLGTKVRRDGDDLFIEDGKLSVSIATSSPISTMIHIGVNANNKNTPIKTSSLEDLEVEPEVFAKDIIALYCQEIHSIQMARCKVIGVK